MSNGKIIQENGENIMPITYETCVLDDEGNPITETIGDVSLLNTESKNLVGAVNEVFGDIIKEQVVDMLYKHGIEASVNENWIDLIGKLSTEIDKPKVVNVISSDEIFMSHYDFVPTSKYDSYTGIDPKQFFYFKCTFNGSITCSTIMRSSNNEYNAYITVNQLRNNEIVFTKTYSTTADLEINCLIDDIVAGDCIEILGSTETNLSVQSICLTSPVCFYGSII